MSAPADPSRAGRAWFGGRLLGGLVLALAAAAVCVMLGMWQLGVARDEGDREARDAAAHQPEASLTSLITPHTNPPATLNNRAAVAVGHYDAAGQVVIVNRRLGQASGYWVVTPFVVQDTGARLPVLRGFVAGEPPADSASVPAPPTGTLEIHGTIGPSESPDVGPALPAGQFRSVDLSVLVNRWPGVLYNAMLLVTHETTPAGTAVAPTAQLQRVPPPTVTGSLSWRNTAYAAQWWVFGAFVLWLWVKAALDARAASQFAGPKVVPADPPGGHEAPMAPPVPRDEGSVRP